MIGGGAAGLAAARAAAHAGARVIVCDENARWGGGLRDARRRSTSEPAREWIAATARELQRQPDVTLLSRTTAFGYYDGNLVGAVERVTDHLPAPPTDVPRQRLWKIRAQAVVLASGANRARRSLMRTTTCRARCSPALRARTSSATACGPARAPWSSPTTTARTRLRSRCRLPASTIAAIVDARPIVGTRRRADRETECGLRHCNAAIVARVTARITFEASTSRRSRGGRDADASSAICVCVSGGWSPAVHLFSQARGKLRYDDALAAFVPDASPLPIVSRGRGQRPLRSGCGVDRGPRCRRRCRRARRLPQRPLLEPPRAQSHARSPLLPLWAVPARSKSAQELRRSAKRCDGQRHRARGARGLSIDRASEALHHARHGHRSGQDQQHRRPRADGASNSACRFRRSARRHSARRTRR